MRLHLFIAASLAPLVAASCQEPRSSSPVEPASGRRQELNGSPLDMMFDHVLGQPNLRSFAPNNADLGGFDSPRAVAVDRARHRVYVADANNSRVLVWLDGDALAMGKAADFAIGGTVNDTVTTPPTCALASATTLCRPAALAVDGTGNLYVADTGNHRVLEFDWPLSDGAADRVFGQADFYSTECASRSTGMCNPTALAVEPGTGVLFVADTDNNRVLRFDAPLTSATPQVALGQSSLSGCNLPNSANGLSLGAKLTVTVDRTVTPNRLYVADTEHNRVLVWSNSAAAQMTPPDFVIGQPNLCATECNNGGLSARTLCGPTAMAVDSGGNLAVADSENDRILYFPSPFTQWAGSGGVSANVVLGQPDFVTHRQYLAAANTVQRPYGVAFNPVSGQLAVTDTNRLLVFNRPTSNFANAVSCTSWQTQFWCMTTNPTGGRTTGLSQGKGLAFDASGRLYVTDSLNHRVVVEASGGTTNHYYSYVYGQTMVDTMGWSGSALNQLNTPSNVAVDGSGNVFIADSGNSRVLGYYPPPATAGPSASFSMTGLSKELWVDVDAAGNVIVADGGNHRILTFLAPAGHGEAADRVLAQPNLTATAPQASLTSGLSHPAGLALTSGTAPALLVGDRDNNRIVVFDDALRAVTGNALNASKTIGQADAQSNACGAVSTSTICAPTHLDLDAAGNLFAVDSARFRVLEFDQPLTGDRLADRVYGQQDFTSASGRSSSGTCPTATSTGSCFLASVAADWQSRLLVVDSGFNRALRFDTPLTAQPAAPGRAPNLALGQHSLTGDYLNGVDAAGLDTPMALALDKSVQPNRLYVADQENNRILAWADATAFKDGAPADLVIGQADFHVGPAREWAVRYHTCPRNGTICEPSAIAVDGQGNLWVLDTAPSYSVYTSNYVRLQFFPTPFAAGRVAPQTPTRVLSKPGTLYDNCPTNNKWCNPNALAADKDGWLFMSDAGNNRVLGFAPGAATPSIALGQLGSLTSVSANNGGIGPRSLKTPTVLATDPSGRLYVFDAGNSRLLRFSRPHDAGGDVADAVLGQPDFVTASSYAFWAGSLAANSNSLFLIGDPSDFGFSDFGSRAVLEFPLPSGNNEGPRRYMRSTPINTCRASSLLVCAPTALAADEAGTVFVADAPKPSLSSSGSHRVGIISGNTPPSALQARIVPNPPSVGDALVATYNFVDAQQQPESGSRLTWYRNGARVAAYDDLKTLPLNAIQAKGETWFFEVRPSDGVYFGTLVRSPSVTVRNAPPVASEVSIYPAEPTKESGLRVEWYYSDADGDPKGPERVRWTLNGVDAPFSGPSVPSSALARGQRWMAYVRAFDGFDYGAEVPAEREVTIGDSLPQASAVRIEPGLPTSSDSLKALFELTDADPDPLVGLITWYRNGAAVAPLRSPTALTAPGPIVMGDRWQFRVTPNDGLADGAEVASQVVEIGGTQPVVSNLRFAPASPTSSDALAAAWDFASRDSRPDLSRVRWFMNQVVQADLDGLEQLPAGRLQRGQTWYFTVEPFDGTLSGPTQTSRPVIVRNSAPRGAWARIDPAQARGGDELTATWDYFDQDGDPDRSTVTWTNRGADVAQGRKLPAASVKKGDVWAFRVALNDGTPDLGPTLTSAPLIIPNTAPSIDELLISPAQPKASDELRVEYTFSDRDGDADQTTAFSWTLNGTPVANLDGARTVPRGRLSKGQQWACTATPFDGTALGAAVISAPVTVGNSAPAAIELGLDPAAPMADDPLTARYTFSDADGDPEATAQTEIVWLRNGQVWGNGPTVPAGVVRRNEQWGFTVVPHDGTEAGAPASFGPITVGNRPPLALDPVILPAHPTRETRLLASYRYQDDDGDAEGATTIVWSLNGRPYGGGTTIDPLVLAKGQVWSFAVTPSDGMVPGAESRSPEVTIENSAPVADAGPDQGASPTEPEAAVQLDGSLSSDVDGDQLSYEWYDDSQAPARLLATIARPEVRLGVGRHEIRLVVSDGAASGEDRMVVNVADQLPIITLDAERAVPPGRVELKATAVDPLKRPLSYHWTQISGEAVALEGADTLEPSFFALSAGDRVFELEVQEDASSATARTTIRMTDVPPFAALDGRYVLAPGQPLRLDASLSSDPNGQPLTFAWEASPGLQLDPDAEGGATVRGEDGVYEVRLTANDGALDSATARAEVIVLDPGVQHAPVADAGLDRRVKVLEEVHLDGAASYDLDGDALRYYWSQVSGPAVEPSSPYEPTLTLRPAAPGEYLFALRVKDARDQPAEDQVVLTVYDPELERNLAPRANAGADQVAAVGQEVVLDGSGTDPEHQPVRFAWRQVWGPRVSVDDDQARQPRFTAIRPGLLRFELVVSDGKLPSAPAQVSVFVAADGNQQPAASAGADQALVMLGSSPLLDGRGSVDPDGGPERLRYRWQQVAGTPAVLSDWSAPTAEVSARAPGDYAFALVVSDGQIVSAPDEVVVHVATHDEGNLPPIAVASGPGTGAIGVPITLDGSQSSDPDPLDRISLRWQFIGYPGNEPPVFDDPTAAKPTFNVTRDGDYTARLVASDGELRSAPAFVFVHVGGPPESCGCSSSSAGGLAGLGAIGALWALRRRRPARAALLPFAALLAFAFALAGCRGRTEPAPAGQGRAELQALAPIDVDPDQVLGQTDFEDDDPNIVDARGVNGAYAIAVDPRPGLDHVYLADKANHRVLAWESYAALSNGKPADRVIGQPDLAGNLCQPASPTSICDPISLAVDANGVLYVAEAHKRVLAFDRPFETDLAGDRVFCRTNMNTREAGSAYVSSVAVGGGYLFVGCGNTFGSNLAWITRYDLSQPSPAGVTLAPTASNGTWYPGTVDALALDLAHSPPALYVADVQKNRLLKYDNPLTASNAYPSAIIGQTSPSAGACNQACTSSSCARGNLCAPSGLWAAADRLWVSDGGNSRVVGYPYAALPAGGLVDPDVVVGQAGWLQYLGYQTAINGQCNRGGAISASGLCNNRGIAFAPDGALLVADTGNMRAVRVPSPTVAGASATLVLAQPRMTDDGPNWVQAEGLSGPMAIAVDRSESPNRVYVADTGNNRVLGWADDTRRATGAAPDLVLGQADFITRTAGTSSTKLRAPAGLAVDPSGGLYVSDTGNHRVLYFPAPFTAGNGAAASRILGQTTATGGLCNQSATANAPTDAAKLCSPRSLATDASGNLYVADYDNYRVVLVPKGQTSATRAYGQAGLTSRTTNGCAQATFGPNTICRPAGIAIDDAGILYIADGSDASSGSPQRIVGIRTPLTSSTPTIVIGHADLYTWPVDWQKMILDELAEMVSNGTDLYVIRAPIAGGGSDPEVVRIANPSTRPTFVQSFTWTKNPRGLAVSSAGNLYVGDPGANRVMLFLANTLPLALEPVISPASPLGGEALTASWFYSDAEGHPQSGSRIRWFKNGVEVPAWADAAQIPAGVIRRDERWSFEVTPRDGYEYGAKVTSEEITVRNAPPTGGVTIVATNPGSPDGITSRDGLTAVITYQDADGDPRGPEQIIWYLDNVAQEYTGQLQIPASATRRGQTWRVEVLPFDGTDYGTPVSASATIIDLPPSAANVRIVPAAPVSLDELTVVYDFSDPDPADAEAATRYRWYRDGQLALSGVSKVPPPLKAGETWTVVVEPGDGQLYGPPVTSAPVTVASSPPAASAAAILPANPTSSDDLTATWSFSSVDDASQLGSQIAWLKNGLAAGITTGTVPSSAVRRGELWSFTVRPCDSYGKCGAPVASPEVLIGNSAPSVQNAAVSPANPAVGAELTAVYGYSDRDGDPDRSEVTWYRNGLRASTGPTVPGELVEHFDRWSFTVQSKDGSTDGNSVTSAQIAIANTPPQVAELTILPAAPRASAPLLASYVWIDADRDAESGSEFVWTLDGATASATGPQVPAALLAKGQTWAVSMRPRDGVDFGATASAAPVTILNSAPVASNLRLTPPAPITGEALAAAFDYADADKADPQTAPAATEVRWLRNGVDTGITGAAVPADVIKRGERWSFQVTPHDGAEAGATVALPEVVVGNRPPVASDPVIVFDSPTASSALTAQYAFSDVDLDSERGSLISWYLQGIAQPGLNGRTLRTGAGVTLRKGQQWFFRVRPSDGYAFGAEVESPPVVLENQAPLAVAGPDQVLPAAGTTTPVALDASASSDPDDGDQLLFTWSWEGAAGTVTVEGQRVTADLPVGSHRIVLTASDGQLSAQDELMVVVQDSLPAVEVEPSREVGPGRVALEGRAYDSLQRPMRYAWTQLSGKPVVLHEADTLHPWFFELESGPFSFQLKASTGTGDSLPVVAEVAIRNVAPTALVFPIARAEAGEAVVPSVIVEVGEPVLLDGSASSDPNGDPLTASWSLHADDPRGELLDTDLLEAQLIPRAEGVYHANLVVNDGWLASAATERSTVVIWAVDPSRDAHAPVANAGPDLTGELGTEVKLDGSRSFDFDGDELEFLWSQESEGGAPAVELARAGAGASFMPRQAGTYRFQLRVRAGGEESAPDGVEVRVGDPQVNLPPVADLRVLTPVPAHVGDRVVLDGSLSYDNEFNELEATWTQIDGVQSPLEEVPDQPGQRAFTALRPGVMAFQLVVTEKTEAGLASAPARVWFQVLEGENDAPIAEAGPAQQVMVDQYVRLDGRASSDPDGDGLEYRWRQTRGTPVTLRDWDEAQPSFLPRATGTYVFELIVTDGQVASAPDAVEVVVGTHGPFDQAPIAVIDGPTTAEPDVPITLDGSRSSDPDPLDRIKFKWEVVGFPTAQQPVLDAPAAPTTTFVASAPGEYAIRLTVTDGELWSAPAYLHVTVNALAAPEPQSCGGCGAAAGAPLAWAALLAAASLLGRRRSRPAARG